MVQEGGPRWDQLSQETEVVKSALVGAATLAEQSALVGAATAAVKSALVGVATFGRTVGSCRSGN